MVMGKIKRVEGGYEENEKGGRVTWGRMSVRVMGEKMGEMLGRKMRG